MSLIQQFRDKISGYEGYAEAWIVSKETAIVTHIVALLAGAVLGCFICR